MMDHRPIYPGIPLPYPDHKPVRYIFRIVSYRWRECCADWRRITISCYLCYNITIYCIGQCKTKVLIRKGIPSRQFNSKSFSLVPVTFTMLISSLFSTRLRAVASGPCARSISPESIASTFVSLPIFFTVMLLISGCSIPVVLICHKLQLFSSRYILRHCIRSCTDWHSIHNCLVFKLWCLQ